MDNTTSQKSQPKSDGWFTPPFIFGALGETFDLDVAAPPEGPRYVPARRYFSKLSLERRWTSFVSDFRKRRREFMEKPRSERLHQTG